MLKNTQGQGTIIFVYELIAWTLVITDKNVIDARKEVVKYKIDKEKKKVIDNEKQDPDSIQITWKIL